LSTVERAAEIAALAHAGQVDKVGEPYIGHPTRVAARVTGDDARIVALLHDVVEDSGWTFDELAAEGFTQAQLDAIDALTKRAGEPLEASMARVAALPLAVHVKKADLADNADPARLARLDAAKRAKLERKYTRSAELIGTTLQAVLAGE
jgi:(p)ppGpp synthase/HD superfamily hydrolase